MRSGPFRRSTSVLRGGYALSTPRGSLGSPQLFASTGIQSTPRRFSSTAVLPSAGRTADTGFRAGTLWARIQSGVGERASPTLLLLLRRPGTHGMHTASPLRLVRLGA